jgi:NADH-quinone oxidoreductase subunit H
VTTMDYYVISAVKAALLMGFLLLTLLYLQWIERKVIAHVQVRIGPHRVGPHGLLQPVADSLKLLLKEDLIPPHVNKFLYLLAPFIAVTLALVSYAVIPFGPEVEIFGVRTRLQLADLDIAVLFVLAVSSMTVYAIVLAGWASNSKYPLLGALRSAAQMISYELPLALAVAAPLLLANTLNLREIVERQEGYYLGFLPRWNIFQLPAPQLLGFVVFVVAMFAETNRVPFDLPERKTSWSPASRRVQRDEVRRPSSRPNTANMITVSAMATLLFLGGWLPPWPARLGSDWVPSVLFLGAGALTLYHGLNAVRARDRRHAARGGRRVLRPRLGICRAFPAPCDRAALLVPGQGRAVAVDFHVGARHAATFPLRPAHALRLGDIVPVGRGESGGHRPAGRRVRQRLKRRR